MTNFVISGVNWEDVFSKVVHGHFPPVKEALSASRLEAQEFLTSGVIFKGADVLDVGCGTGRQLFGLLEQGVNSYVGIDPMKQPIDFCNREIAPLAKNAKFIHIDLFNEFYNLDGKMRPEEMVLPFPDASFDAVITSSVFTHLGTSQVCSRYLSEIARVLRPKGKLFSSWFRNPPNPLNEDRMRTVFLEGEILGMVTEFFKIYTSRGGFSEGFHDQWCLFCQKR